MKPEKWKTSVPGEGPWMVSDNDYQYSLIIGQFRFERHADLFINALNIQAEDTPNTKDDLTDNLHRRRTGSNHTHEDKI